MRLICPNCGAQYEVPDNVIPENGRDVQCSNCGDTWFQKHPSQDRDLAEELDQTLDEAHWDTDDQARTPDDAQGGWEDTRNEALPSSDADAPDAEQPYDAPPRDDQPTDDDTSGPNQGPDQGPDQELDQEPDHERDHEGALAGATDADIWPETDPDPDLDDAAESAPDTWPEEEDTPAAPPPPADEAPQPRGLDPEVRDVLREEADFELRARSAQGGTLEEQPDLGLDATEDEASRREREARQRMARMRGMSDEEAASAAAGAGLAAQTSRRDLLPDIDEINSTLRRSSARGEAPEIDHSTTSSAPEKQRGGFRRGFMTLILIAIIALLLYIYAPKIAEMVPALSGALEAYVSAINSARAWLDGQILSLLGWLDGMSSGGDAAAPASGS